MKIPKAFMEYANKDVEKALDYKPKDLSRIKLPSYYELKENSCPVDSADAEFRTRRQTSSSCGGSSTDYYYSINIVGKTVTGKGFFYDSGEYGNHSEARKEWDIKISDLELLVKTVRKKE